ncbi:NAD(P)-dependent dehydrogenase (short-subunit alcohol dehydrogenase family) [Spinactinospora alkalitolerans]|uniref:NAD(P)-dependent dehydrogenase (Short-subunit alcohol dehydrogenase family) n=1 Tax=Spinactinospora alkalitolerans TaxID=687207 RepID=A0A852TUT6_9ACTN|nr:SDR family oxidoreductase [Spinactinospora alkalitolerans]NYE48206.1 NAD(P)-dependent dehydrogenase (short-subunit alcohol dehydrogenase family) [Spinactinospora alkalitolerans]
MRVWGAVQYVNEEGGPEVESDFVTRTALVTGGASGIGAAMARQFVAAGGRCVIGDVQDERGRALARELGPGCRYEHLDVTDEDDMRAAIDRTVDAFGALDCFFGNAGIVGALGPIERTPAPAWDRTVSVLLRSAFLGVKHAVPVMRSQGSGAIVCTASVASLRGGLGPHAYTAAKHGVWGLVRSVAAEIGAYGLRINCVAPGGTVSALSASLVSGDGDDLDAAYRRLAAASSSGRPTTADDVASAALFLAGPGAARINGACLAVDGGDDLVAHKARGYFEADGSER